MRKDILNDADEVCVDKCDTLARQFLIASNATQFYIETSRPKLTSACLIRQASKIAHSDIQKKLGRFIEKARKQERIKSLVKMRNVEPMSYDCGSIFVEMTAVARVALLCAACCNHSGFGNSVYRNRERSSGLDFLFFVRCERFASDKKSCAGDI